MSDLAKEGLAYFDRAGDDGDRLYVAAIRQEIDKLGKDAERWRAMRQTLVAADFAPEMGGGPVVMFACHAERVGFGPEGADEIADAAVDAMNGANAGIKASREAASP